MAYPPDPLVSAAISKNILCVFDFRTNTESKKVDLYFVFLKIPNYAYDYVYQSASRDWIMAE
jgi:hypothetical protein